MRWACDGGMYDVTMCSPWMIRKTNIQNQLKSFTNGSLIHILYN